MNYKQIAHVKAQARATTTHGVSVAYRCPRCNAEHGTLLTWDGTPWWTCSSCDLDVDVTNLVSIRWPH